MPNHEVHYNDYLELEKILNAQHPESDRHNLHAHDEMLFIIIHQAYELWFKQILFEVEFASGIMNEPSVNDNSPQLQTVVHSLHRVATILKVLVHQLDIMETMTAMDFLDFRDMLRPASGFQSWQFKAIEARLGLKHEQRFGQEYYSSQLSQAELETLHSAEQQQSLLALVNIWLERMPFFSEKQNWTGYGGGSSQDAEPGFWADYRLKFAEGYGKDSQVSLLAFDKFFFENKAGVNRNLSAAACRAALFIMLYRGYPLLQLPFQLLNNLLEIDEQLSTWRYRHLNMVHRMIGGRTGTGGSTGKSYLAGAADKHYIFHEIAQVAGFLIERRRLPQLTKAMERRLGFAA